MKKKLAIYAVLLVLVSLVITFLYNGQDKAETAPAVQAVSSEVQDTSVQATDDAAAPQTAEDYAAIDPHDERLDYSLVFDADQYAEINPDIAQNIAKDKLFDHFLADGMDEGRRANDKFDVNTYMANNDDLHELFGDNKRLYYYHYMLYGHAENRVAI